MMENRRISRIPPTAEELAALYFDAGFTDVINVKKLERAVASTSEWYVVRDDAGAAIGIGRFISDYARYACVYDLIVEKSWRDKGIGRRIMEEIIHDCRLLELDVVHLWPSGDKVDFYRALGFEPLGADQPFMKLKN